MVGIGTIYYKTLRVTISTIIYMKKTIPTSIANTLFYIEEDTYKSSKVPASIRQHFAGQDDSIEIIHDIEDRIREQFISYTEASAKKWQWRTHHYKRACC